VVSALVADWIYGLQLKIITHQCNILFNVPVAMTIEEEINVCAELQIKVKVVEALIPLSKYKKRRYLG
jgi:hypothetical protein